MKKTNPTFIVLVIVVIAFSLYNTFFPQSKKPPKYASDEILTQMSDYIASNPMTSSRFLLEMFESKDIVFLGEMNMVKQHVDLVSAMLPELHEEGINILAVEYALWEDQDLIDTVLNSETYDETLVREVLFNRLCLWGYEEYADVFKAAWNINRNLGDDEKPFRIIGLNVKNDWTHIKTEKDMEDNALMNKVMSRGVPEIFMADVIKTEIVNSGRKALIHTTQNSAVTNYVSMKYKESAETRGLDDSRRMGNIIEELNPDKTATILLHSPWYQKSAEYNMGYPARGAIDKFIDELPREKRHFAFETEKSPFGTLPVLNEDYLFGYDQLYLSDICDGYIVLGPISKYKSVTAIDGFIDENNIREAIRDFPGPDPGEDLTPENLNGFISGRASNMESLFEKL